MSFHLKEFISACLSEAQTTNATSAIAALVREAVAHPEQIREALGEPEKAGIDKLYVSANLTILNVVWAPGMTLRPHNHNTWAVIGVYCGREDNIFWRRLEDSPRGSIEAAGARSIASGEAVALGKSLIHSVTNPVQGFTGAIHVYGGNFFEIERSEWEPETLEECAYDVNKTLELFEAENALLKLRSLGVDTIT